MFHRLSYEHQLEIAEKFLTREIEFLTARGHKLELDKTALPFLVRKGFHPKLGARPMRDAAKNWLATQLANVCLVRGRRAVFSRWTKRGIASSSFDSIHCPRATTPDNQCKLTVIVPALWRPK